MSQDVKSFLAKPVKITSGNFSPTDTFSTFSAVFLPLQAVDEPVYAQKLAGFLGFRATMVIRMVVNANRFQQGRYMLIYAPVGGADTSLASHGIWVNDHLSTLVQRTTMPHVELDLCCDTECTIKIPFNSALNYYPIASSSGTNGLGQWGMLLVNPYVPLASVTGNLTAAYTVYCHFEDVQLVSATVPQSPRLAFTKKSKKSESEVEQDSVNIGPVSSALIKVRDAANIFSNVPLISSYASSVSWFSDIAANAAKVFGWSKPVVLAPSTRVTQNYLPYFANTDATDLSFPLSYSSTNSVGTACGFSGTDVDEMSIPFLASIPVWMATQSWATETTMPVDTLILNTDVSPSAGMFSTVVNTATFFHFSPLQYLTQFFSYWRGSIVYKLKFVKTEFHSGRLSVTFNPYNSLVFGTVTPTLADSPFIHRQIIDIREANEFTFVIPYVADSPYRSTTLSDPGEIGTFTIRVLDPLVAPSTVSQTVSIIIEKHAGPDMELAVPRINNFNYFTGITPQSGSAFSSVEQGSTVCSNLNTTIGNSVVQSDGNVNSLHCIGEKILNLRSLLKIPQALSFVSVTPAANYLNIIPYIITAGRVNGVTNTSPVVNSDNYSRLACCYLYSRGGVRLKFLDNSAVTIPQPIAVVLDTRTVTGTTFRSNGIVWNSANAASTTNATDRSNMPVVVYRSGYSGEVQIPQYHRYHSRLNSYCVGANGLPYSADSVGFSPQIAVTRKTIPNAIVDCIPYRSISDDGNFGGFLSVPPMLGVTSVDT